MKVKNKQQPEGWKMLTIGEILTDDQFKKVVKIMLEKSGDTTQERVKKMKQYLNTLEGQLNEKGIVPDYLAYYLEYLFTCHREATEKNK